MLETGGLLPVASFVTPATLTVRLVSTMKSHMRHVPQVDFKSLNFAFLPVANGPSSVFNHAGPQYLVQRVVSATLTQGEMLLISLPKTSSFWMLDFHDPAVKCAPVNAT